MITNMNKKALLPIVAAITLTSVIAQAQTTLKAGGVGPTNYTDLGIKAGANFQQIVAYPFNQNYGTGFIGGLYAERRIHYFGVKAEVTVSSAQYITDFPASKSFNDHKYMSTDTTSKGDFSVLNVNIPMMFEINTGKRLTILFGAQYSQQVSVNDNNGVYSKVWGTDKLFKESNISLVYGLEYLFLHKFKIGATYTQGFQDINNQKVAGIDGRWMAGGAQVYLNYRVKRWFRGKN